MSDIKIFVSHRIDKDSVTIDNPLYVNVRCGAVYDKRSPEEIGGMLGDDTGDNISEKRMSFCELTVQYWAWKNVEADYYGLCHYRRYFSFSNERLAEDVYGNINYQWLNKAAIDDLCLNPKVMTDKISQYDFLISAPFDTKKAKIASVYNQYKTVPELNIKDLDCIIDIIKEMYPDYYLSAVEYFNGHLFYPCNLFIMKKELFYSYCEWIFSILHEFEQRMDMTNYCEEGIRTPGHLGERLLGVYYTYLLHKNKYKIHTLQRAIFWNTERLINPYPKFQKNNIPIIMASSDFYTPYAGATIQSILNCSSKDYNYDIVILNTEITKSNKNLLLKLIQDYPNFSIRFLNVGSEVSNFKFVINNHVSIETFYRLFVQKIFLNYDKILYLDSDVIVKTNLAELYSIDIGDSLIAATLDADFIGEYNGAIPKIKKYCDGTLKLNNPYQYFQAGVLVFNIKEFNKTFAADELVEFASRGEYMYVDQDVLNVKCQGRVYYLDMSWNVMTDCANSRISIIKRAPIEIYKTYMEARKHPKIIHYAGFSKPWNKTDEDMAAEFWNVIRMTPLYEHILSRMSADISWHTTNAYLTHFSKKQLMRNVFYRILEKAFPKGTLRREKIKQIYFKFHARN